MSIKCCFNIWKQLSYYFQVIQLAAVLRKHGVCRGDVVLIYMPMIPQAVIAMLATIRLGATHCLVFGGFASAQLATRINHAEVSLIFSISDLL